MARSEITTEVLRDYLQCKYKSSLRLAGHGTAKSDYEAALIELRQTVRHKAIEKIDSQRGKYSVANRIVLTHSSLSSGDDFIVDGQYTDGEYLVLFDALKRVDGQSSLGDFHYQPVLFSEHRQIRKIERTLLEVLGVLLSRVQGRRPSGGVIYHGRECIVTNVRFPTSLKVAEGLMAEIHRIREGESDPALVLNEHCPACEFREQCHSRAVREDNVTLLRGLGKKEIKHYARKGLLTLTQLAYTFRPRRQGRRTIRRSKKRYHVLQAMAIRDKRIYVLGTPEVPTAEVRIYLDLEGNPEEGFVYLIGMTVREGESETHYSFWADDKAQEVEIFEQFLAALSRYDAPLIFCWGSYERTFIKRMRRYARRKKPVDRVLGSLVNVLSTVFSYYYFPTYSNSLKEIAGCFGYNWTDQNSSGLQSIAWRMRWEATRDRSLIT